MTEEPSAEAQVYAERLRRAPLHPRGHYYQVALAIDAAVEPRRAKLAEQCGRTLAAIIVLREIASEPWSADPWVYAERMSRRAAEVLAVIAPPQEDK